MYADKYNMFYSTFKRDYVDLYITFKVFLKATRQQSELQCERLRTNTKVRDVLKILSNT